MKMKIAMFTAVCALIAAAPIHAQDPSKSKPKPGAVPVTGPAAAKPVGGFGSGNGIGPGGNVGSPSSLSGGFGSPSSGSGAGSQGFGGGFPGSGPLSIPVSPAASAAAK